MNKETAVEWLKNELNNRCDIIGNYDSIIDIFQQAKEMENRQSENYAEFAIHCDRQQMKILIFNDWIKL